MSNYVVANVSGLLLHLNLNMSVYNGDIASVQEGDMMKSMVYLELATRAGERAASHVKNVILRRLSAASRDHVMHLAERWRALPSS